LGRERLVRRAWRIRVVAVGLVGFGARARSTPKPLAISLAGAVRLLGRHWRISLHGFDARDFDHVVVDQVASRNEKLDVCLADAWRRRTRFWNVCAGMAGNFGLRPRFRARLVCKRRALAMDCAVARVAWIHFALLDS